MVGVCVFQVLFHYFYEILNAHHSINNIRYVHFKRIISNLLVSIQE
jgi:hypothetical protein